LAVRFEAAKAAPVAAGFDYTDKADRTWQATLEAWYVR
jgi:hypothetical protein